MNELLTLHRVHVRRLNRRRPTAWRVGDTPLLIFGHGRVWEIAYGFSLSEQDTLIVQDWLADLHQRRACFDSRRDAHRTICALLAASPLPTLQPVPLTRTEDGQWVTSTEPRMTVSYDPIRACYHARDSDEEIIADAPTLTEIARMIARYLHDQNPA